MRVETTVRGERLAVSRNVSKVGLLMVTATEIALGAPVVLTLRVESAESVGPTEHRVEGSIVRFQPNEEDPNGLWPFLVAVEFAEPDEVLEEVIVELGFEAE